MPTKQPEAELRAADDAQMIIHDELVSLAARLYRRRATGTADGIGMKARISLSWRHRRHLACRRRRRIDIAQRQFN